MLNNNTKNYKSTNDVTKHTNYVEKNYDCEKKIKLAMRLSCALINTPLKHVHRKQPN